jgi:hypothetical protein
MEKSRFERLSDSSLIRYCNFVKNVIKDETFYDIEDFYDFFKPYNRKSGLRKQIEAPLGGEFSRLDVEYLFFLLWYGEIQENTIRRPKLVEKDISYVTEERIRTTIRRSGEMDTYIPNSLTQSYLFDLKSEGEFEPYDWDETDREETDWDQIDDWFDV